MAYIKLDDGWPEHPKILSLSDTARVLYVNALCYANRRLTDGEIPLAAVRLIHLRARQRHVQELLEAGLWEAGVLGYQIHDYLVHQTSREEVEAGRQATRERLARWRQQKRDGNAVTEAVTNDHVTPDVTPTETEEETETEDPSIPSGSREGRRRRARRTAPPTVSDDCREQMAAKYGDRLGGTDVVAVEIDRALNNKAVLRAIDPERYVDTWLRREVDFRAERSGRNGSTKTRPGADAKPLGWRASAEAAE